MKYKIYYGQDKCKIPGYLLNMITSSETSLAEYIRNMPEPTIEVEDGIVTMTFEPISADIASALIEDDRLRFQVVRHKANSSHTQQIDFPYSFNHSKYINYSTGIPNEKYGLSIPNNGYTGAEFKCVTRPTISELTSGTITRDMSGLLDNIRLHKCQVKGSQSPWEAEFYFGFIYWRS